MREQSRILIVTGALLFGLALILTSLAIYTSVADLYFEGQEFQIEAAMLVLLINGGLLHYLLVFAKQKFNNYIDMLANLVLLFVVVGVDAIYWASKGIGYVPPARLAFLVPGIYMLIHVMRIAVSRITEEKEEGILQDNFVPIDTRYQQALERIARLEAEQKIMREQYVPANPHTAAIVTRAEEDEKNGSPLGKDSP